MDRNCKPLIILTGPTAVGKTKLSIGLAKALNGCVISADSMQVYKYMDIGSAKVTKQEMDGVKHYLIDVLDPTEDFNVTVFQRLAGEAVKEIYANGQIPIVVGGTGFYIQALLYDIDFTKEEEDSAYRHELENLAAEKGPEFIHDMLKAVDPKSAEIIHYNNVKRVIRALEFYKKSGIRISVHNEEQRQNESPYDFKYYVLTDDRKYLYDRIELRVDKMLEDGLVDEVKHLKEMGCTREMTSMAGLGYKEILDYLDGKLSLEEAVFIIKRDTRHFAKRQLTWFRREKCVSWIDKQEFDRDDGKILEFMLKDIDLK